MTEISVMFEGGAMRRFPAGTTAGDALWAQAEADGGKKSVKRARSPAAADAFARCTAGASARRRLDARGRLGPVRSRESP